MDKTNFLETLDGKLCNTTVNPVEVITDTGEHIEVTSTVSNAPVIIDSTYNTKSRRALIPCYTDSHTSKNRGPQESKYTHREYKKARSKKRKMRRSNH